MTAIRALHEGNNYVKNALNFVSNDTGEGAESTNKTINILDCDQFNVLLARIIFSCILLTAF